MGICFLIRTYGLKADLMGRLIGAALKIPVNITSVQSIDLHRKWYHTLLDRSTAGLTNLYLANSEAGRLAVHQREKIPFAKTLTIPSGVECAYYDGVHARAQAVRASLRASLGIPATAPVIGLIAHFWGMKGHTTMVDALLRMRARFPELRCLFVGEDFLHGQIQRYVAAHGAAPMVIFTGFRRDVAELLAVLDIFALPSEWEGLPMTILEAMAMRKPVIASAVGGIPELVNDGETGLLIPPKDPAILADKLMYLLDHPEIAARLGQAGYERVRRHFAIDQIVARTEATYAALIDEKRHHRFQSNYK